MFAINHAALLSETAPPAQKDADAGQDLELEELGLASPGSMPHQSDASPAWEDFTQRLQEEKTDDTATSPGEKRKQADKEKPEQSKAAMKRRKSGLPEELPVPEEGPEAAKKDEESAAAPAPSSSKSDSLPAEPAAATTMQEEQAVQHNVPSLKPGTDKLATAIQMPAAKKLSAQSVMAAQSSGRGRGGRGAAAGRAGDGAADRGRGRGRGRSSKLPAAAAATPFGRKLRSGTTTPLLSSWIYRCNKLALM